MEVEGGLEDRLDSWPQLLLLSQVQSLANIQKTEAILSQKSILRPILFFIKDISDGAVRKFADDTKERRSRQSAGWRTGLLFRETRTD